MKISAMVGNRIYILKLRLKIFIKNILRQDTNDDKLFLKILTSNLKDTRKFMAEMFSRMLGLTLTDGEEIDDFYLNEDQIKWKDTMKKDGYKVIKLSKHQIHND